MFRRISARIKRINECIALNTTRAVGSMWCVYAFAILVVIPFFWPGTLESVQYLSSSFIQLVFLPLLMVGQSIEGRSAERRAREDHNAIIKIMRELHEMREEPCECKKKPPRRGSDRGAKSNRAPKGRKERPKIR